MRILMLAVCALAMASCGGPTAPKEETKPTSEAAPVSSTDASLAMLNGRWGVTTEACAPNNDARDGVVEITDGAVQIGLDRCAIGSQSSDKPAADVVGFDIKAQCKGGEGEDYAGEFRFVTSTGGETMTLVMKDSGAEPYSRCE